MSLSNLSDDKLRISCCCLSLIIIISITLAQLSPEVLGNQATFNTQQNKITILETLVQNTEVSFSHAHECDVLFGRDKGTCHCNTTCIFFLLLVWFFISWSLKRDKLSHSQTVVNDRKEKTVKHQSSFDQCHQAHGSIKGWKTYLLLFFFWECGGGGG